MYKHNPKNYKVHSKPIPLVTVTGISLSPLSDGYIIIHIQRPGKDIIVDCDKYVELVTVIFTSIQRLTGNNIEVKFADKITYFHGKEYMIQFQKGPKAPFQKGPKGVFIVTSP